MDSNQEEQKHFTPEEIKARQDQIMASYKEQIKYLKVEKEYQELVTDIEELRMRYIRAQIMIANAMAPPPQETPEGPEAPEAPQPDQIVPPRERKLKTAAHA